jgi:hypothetical protein
MQGCGSVSVFLSSSLLRPSIAAGLGAENPPHSGVQFSRATSVHLKQHRPTRVENNVYLAGETGTVTEAGDGDLVAYLNLNVYLIVRRVN